MEMLCDGWIGDELIFGEYLDLLGAKQVEYIFRFKPALVKLFKLVARYLTVSSHLQDSS